MFMALLLLVFLVPPAHAYHYQYKVDTLEVTGGNMDASILTITPGYAYFEQAGEPAYPAPSGCSTGRSYWSAVDQHPNPTRLVVRSGLTIFRCRQVSSAASVDAVVDEESKQLCDSFPQPDPLVRQLKLDVDRVCEGESSADCTAANAAYEAVKAARAPVAATEQAEAKRLTEAIQTLHTEAETFKTAQGW